MFRVVMLFRLFEVSRIVCVSAGLFHNLRPFYPEPREFSGYLIWSRQGFQVFLAPFGGR